MVRHTLEGTLRYVKARRRSQHDVYLSWDEWQVWYKGDPVQGNWEEAPHLAEEMYNLEDALVVEKMLSQALQYRRVRALAAHGDEIGGAGARSDEVDGHGVSRFLA